MADDADWAADMAERERQALIQRHLKRKALPPPPGARAPMRLDAVMDDPQEDGARRAEGARGLR